MGTIVKPLRPVLVLLVALIAAACRGESTGPDEVLAAGPEADLIVATFEDEADLSMGALVAGGTMGTADVGMLDLATLPIAPPRPGLECLVIEPFPPEDPDHDHVPTLLGLSFDPEPCVIRTGTGLAFSFAGSLTLSDPTPNTAAYDLEEVLAEFGHGLQSRERSYMVIRDGVRSVSHQANQLQAQEDFRAKHVVNGEGEKNTQVDWTLDFASQSAIVFGAPLPSGSLEINGTWAISRGDRNRLFMVETVTPLQYDASCLDVRPVFRFTAGEVHKYLVINGERRAVIVITWTGCGERPTREVIRLDDGAGARETDNA